MIETRKYCDVEDGCCFHENGADLDDPRFVSINGKDFCSYHAPCPICGHASFEHFAEHDDPESACQVGRKYIYEHEWHGGSSYRPYRLVSGASVMVEQGCGCTWQPKRN